MADECGEQRETSGPLTAVASWMKPSQMFDKLANEARTVDEFGFYVEHENISKQNGHVARARAAFVENPKQRLEWIAYLEFSHNSVSSSSLSWQRLPAKIPLTDRLSELLRHGVPHSLRAPVWLRLSGALSKKHSADFKYAWLAKRSSGECGALQEDVCRQIENDLLRTLPSNVCFGRQGAPGVVRLRRVLRSLAWAYPDIGYCQGMAHIVSILLLFVDEEGSFWLMAALIEDILPAAYYSPSLRGVHVEQRVLSELMERHVARLHATLRRHDIELSLVTLGWQMALLSCALPMHVLLRVWDLMFSGGGGGSGDGGGVGGSVLLLKAILAMLTLRADEISGLDGCADVFSALSAIPASIDDPELLLKMCCEGAPADLSRENVEATRRRHMLCLLQTSDTVSPSSALSGDLSAADMCDTAVDNCGAQCHTARRHIRRSKSFMSVVLFGEECSRNELKTKNIRQTELIINLRAAIRQLGEHFAACDSRLADNIRLGVDYSAAAHRRDHQLFVAGLHADTEPPRANTWQSHVARRRPRVKAVIDFERRDDDELGFRRHDVITVLSMHDEHCWVGELNGLVGWFPAKFVQPLDERSKLYSVAGDDQVNERVTHLVRGALCSAFKNILEHGMRRSSLIGGACHPWLFIEQVARHEVSRDYDSVYSRLVLCKTYRLDRDGKVLSPEELLYRCVEAVNASHSATHTHMDVKLRSLVCLGLNEQALHLWLETLCTSHAALDRFYLPHSYLNSPGWVQIKCELRVLAQFPFELSVDWELPVKRSIPSVLREGVQDMLVKHHLFSWDL